MSRKQTPAEHREAVLKSEIARCAALQGLKNDTEIAEFLGWTRQKYYKHKYEGFRHLKLEDAVFMAQKLKFNKERWCEACGIKE